jgi:hypothetical protein
MPMVRFKCTDPGCGVSFTKIYRKGPDAPAEIECKKCKARSTRVLSGPASASKITMDNGIQARAVEIYPDVEEIMSERARKPDNRGD